MSESTFKRDVIKISLLGNQSVGKTTIRNVFLKLDFNENSLSTVGINKTDSIIKLDDGNELKLVIWDTAGQERFHSISLSTVKNSQGVILVYDVTNRQSFIDLNIWLDEIKQATDKVSVILFGNKCEMEERQISKEEAKKFAKEHKLPYIETSAKLNLNINEGFMQVAKDAYKKYGTASGVNLKKKRKRRKVDFVKYNKYIFIK